ncbi:MAG: hypothetical protein AAGG11_03485 [Pseudomonadota bacterium]
MQHNETRSAGGPAPAASGLSGLLSSNVYLAFKYAIYLALIGNVFLFLREEYGAAQHLFVDQVPIGQLINAFAASIDTAAWVLLLLLFELETYQIPDERLTPPLLAAFLGFRGLCYLVIGYAFFGYLSKALAFTASPAAVSDACALVEAGRSLMIDLDEFQPLTTANCGTVQKPLRFVQGNVIVDLEVFRACLRLAWTDVVNSGAWLLVVGALEAEVWLQLRGRLTGWIYSSINLLQLLLYLVLFAAAVYWGIAGDFLDFWDACLWLLAFFIIEMNVFQWREETRDGAGPVLA